MLKKTITSKNLFTNEDETEDFYFNLTQAELIELEMSTKGGLEGTITELQRTQNGNDIIDFFKVILRKAYGTRVGGRFIKDPDEFRAFEASPAYSVLFMELVTNAEAAAEFVNGLAPADLVNENQTKLPVDPEKPNLTAVADKPAPRVVNQAEARVMPHDQLSSGLADGSLILG